VRAAFVGKGGAGKSTLVGTVARLLGRAGEPVVVVDSDPMPGLSFALGLTPTDAGIPDEATEEQAAGAPGPRFRLRAGLSARLVVERYGLTAPDGVRVLQLGKLRATASRLVRSEAALREVLPLLVGEDWHVLGDLPGGTRQAFFGWAGYASLVLVVVEATPASVLSARRLARLSAMGNPPPRVVAVLNKAVSSHDALEVARASGLEVVARLPFDAAVAEADRLGRAPIEHAPESPAVVAARRLAERLVELADELAR
jgi:CO dehydrogenase maturation factor